MFSTVGVHFSVVPIELTKSLFNDRVFITPDLQVSNFFVSLLASINEVSERLASTPNMSLSRVCDQLLDSSSDSKASFFTVEECLGLGVYRISISPRHCGYEFSPDCCVKNMFSWVSGGLSLVVRQEESTDECLLDEVRLTYLAAGSGEFSKTANVVFSFDMVLWCRE